MELLDWIVMLGTLLGIVAYGVWKTRHIKSTQSFLLGDRDLPWWTIGLSIMATQASAITFLSTPGQAYADGMRFAQFYFGLPVAMVILSIFFLPIYYRLKVYTAYEYLEGRFDLRTRTLTGILFLISRGLAAGLTIYAPAIILSKILDWSLNSTILFIGILVIIYTVAGGTKAVSMTQKQQMIVILTGMFIAAVLLVMKLPQDVSFGDAVGVAGKMGKLNVVDFTFDLSNRYTFWSGMLGGVFLFLSYFGTDQSQVQRYLSGKSLAESRLGLLFNGIFKVPMQFLILFVGVMVFIFFQFVKPPIHFNEANIEKLEGSSLESEYQELEDRHTAVFEARQKEIRNLIGALRTDSEADISAARLNVETLLAEDRALREEAKELILQQDPDAQVEDRDYVFITFVMRYMPIGLVGLLLAVIFSAAMSSTASELNALATTTVVDIYRRSFKKKGSDRHYLRASKWLTVMWGGIALLFAASANLFENLIQAVNIIGSLFYGTILGIFLVAFFLKRVGARAVFIAAIIAELIIIGLFLMTEYEISIYLFGRPITVNIAYLWLNLIGCSLVMAISLILEEILPSAGKEEV
jgi:SSS family solute:Na+ symporter